MFSPEEELHEQFYSKFRGAMDEYMFLALTEDCHPLIDRCEQIVCAAQDVEFKDYCHGDCEYEDDLRHHAHMMAQRIMTKMLHKFAEMY